MSNATWKIPPLKKLYVTSCQMAPCSTITGVSAPTAKMLTAIPGAIQRNNNRQKKIAIVIRMILRIIPSNGGNDNVIGLERGIHYKPTSSRVAALAIPFDLCLSPDNCPENWARAVADHHCVPFRDEKILSRG